MLAEVAIEKDVFMCNTDYHPVVTSIAGNESCDAVLVYLIKILLSSRVTGAKNVRQDDWMYAICPLVF